MKRDIQMATCLYPNSLSHRRRGKELHPFIQTEPGIWEPLRSMDVLREADKVTLEDGTVVKNRWGVTFVQ